VHDCFPFVDPDIKLHVTSPAPVRKQGVLVAAEMRVLGMLFLVTLLSPRSWRCFLDFWKICGPFHTPSTEFFEVHRIVPRRTNFGAPHCVVSSILLLLPPSSVNVLLRSLLKVVFFVEY
jgi:hypothetical protein